MSLFSRGEKTDDTWVSVSDMMAGLMMVFLFIAIIYIRNIGQYFDDINDIQSRLCTDLMSEFSDQERLDWKMTICEEGLLIRFTGDSHFLEGSAKMLPKLEKILNEFLPRFYTVIGNYREEIEEIRIEGHTNSRPCRGCNQFSGYLYNTSLSQDRSKNVLEFALNFLAQAGTLSSLLDWSYSHLTAHGMSSSQPVLRDEKESFNESRRVEFRIKTTAEKNLEGLIKELGGEKV